MGTVYRAVHATLKQVVALKTIRGDRFHGDRDSAVRRFYREIEAAGAVIHPNVARATDAGEEDGIHFLITEYIDGIDLQRLTKHIGSLPVEAACELLHQACRGLEAIRSLGMVHRDIKPSNVLVTWQGQAKIVDLGLVRVQDTGLTSDPLTSSNKLLGTLDFLAPEQALDAREIDIRADLYSLGCTLFWLATGKPVFGPPDYPSAAQKIRAHCDADPDWDRLRRLDERLVPIAKRLLAKSPKDRYLTPVELAQDLEPLRDKKALLACLSQVRDAPLQKAGSQAFTETASLEYGTTVQAGNSALWKRTRLLAVPTLATVLLLIVGLALFHSPWKSPSEDPPARNALTIVPGASAKNEVAAPPAGPLNLDDRPRWEWHNLLGQSPRVPVWKSSFAGTRWHYDPALKQLLVNCGQIGMLELGTTSASNYIIQVHISQGRMSGGLGIYLGAHPDTYQGHKVLRFQYFQIQSSFVGKKRISLVTRNLGREAIDSNSEFPGKHISFGSQEFIPVQGDQRLEVRIHQGRLVSVSMNDKNLPQLLPTTKRKFDDIQTFDFSGGLGIWAENCNGVITEAQYKNLDEQP